MPEVTAWMPEIEAQALRKLRSEMTLEEWKAHCYFFWNNFSMEGYEEWKESEQAKGIGFE